MFQVFSEIETDISAENVYVNQYIHILLYL